MVVGQLTKGQLGRSHVNRRGQGYVPMDVEM